MKKILKQINLITDLEDRCKFLKDMLTERYFNFPVLNRRKYQHDLECTQRALIKLYKIRDSWPFKLK